MSIRHNILAIIVLLLVLSISISSRIFSPSPSQAFEKPPQKRVDEVIKKLEEQFAKIKDATADITLDYNLYLFGCTGLRRMQGKGWFKAPDKIKAEIDGITYFARKNSIRKIDEKGKIFNIKLINAIDFTPGFNPELIPHNFDLTIIKDGPDEIIIEGLPKPGTLKHVTKVIFHIDTQEHLLRRLDLELKNQHLSGKIDIYYEKIDGIWVPVGFQGKSAIELSSNFLVGLGIKLKGENIKINSGLPATILYPGF